MTLKARLVRGLIITFTDRCNHIARVELGLLLHLKGRLISILWQRPVRLLILLQGHCGEFGQNRIGDGFLDALVHHHARVYIAIRGLTSRFGELARDLGRMVARLCQGGQSARRVRVLSCPHETAHFVLVYVGYVADR